LSLVRTNKSYFFNQEFEFDDKNVSHITDYLNLYEGWLIDEPKTSKVNGILVNNSFYGTIVSEMYGRLFIEPSRRFGNNQNSDDIIYHEDDINYEFLNMKNLIPDDFKSKNKNNNSLMFEKDLDQNSRNFTLSNRTIDTLMYSEKDDYVGLFNRTGKKQNLERYSMIETVKSENSHWTRRSGTDRSQEVNVTERLNFPDHRSVCNMYLKVDPFLYAEVYKNEGNEDDIVTARYLLFFLNKQVEFLNEIFGTIKFFDAKKTKYYQGIKFMIHRTKVNFN